MFTLLSLLICFSTLAQYESFFGKNSTSYSQFFSYAWANYQTDNSPCFIGDGFTFDSYFTKEDTVRINDNLYYKTSYIPNINTNAPNTYQSMIWRDDVEFDFYVREDNITGRLYNFCASRGEEVLWCDMSLMVGDTFYFPLKDGWGFYYFWGDDGYRNYSIVDSIYYINNKKVISFPFQIATYLETEPYYLAPSRKLLLKFIEGIGPLFGPATEKYGNGSKEEVHYTLLLCIHKDDTLTFMTNPIFGCEQVGYVPVKIKENKMHELKLTINLDNTELKVELPDELKNEKGDIYIFDIIGRVLIKKVFSTNPQIIDISNFKHGAYIANFQSNKYRISNKFLKTN